MRMHHFTLEPQPLDEHIVHPAPAPVYGDLRTGRRDGRHEGRTGELRALVRLKMLKLVLPRRASDSAFRQKSVSMLLESRATARGWTSNP